MIVNFANQYITLSGQDKETILHSRKSLIRQRTALCEMQQSIPFDVTMGSYDGAEKCELVGLYIVNKLSGVYKNNSSIGLYRDDGLAVFRGIGARTKDKIRKNVSVIFNEFGLNITEQANLKVVNYLDITLNLPNEKYSRYRQLDNSPPYINSMSNHPTAITNRVSSLSCDAMEFNKAAPIYENALRSSGHTHNLQFTNEASQKAPKKAKHNMKNSLVQSPVKAKNTQRNTGRQFPQIGRAHV